MKKWNFTYLKPIHMGTVSAGRAAIAAIAASAAAFGRCGSPQSVYTVHILL